MRNSKKIVVRKAAGQDELKAVFRLRYDSYLRKGYISPNPDGIMFDEWDELPIATHFVAMEDDQIVGAVRLIMDSAKGLPMERVFPEAIGQLREQGRKVAEASTLVVADAQSDSNHKLWVKLCKILWEEAEARQIDDLCVAVTQNHISFYKRLLFERIGKSAHYKSLNGILAYPLRVRVAEVRARHRSTGSNHDQSLRRRVLE
jgi:N-acyl-L-homoserine lactone synthetase